MKTVASMLMLLLVTGIACAQKPADYKADLLRADLFIAITHDDLGGVQAALSKGAKVNERNWLEFTPLMWAAMRGDQKIADFLLAKGAKLEDSSLYGSAFTFAVNGRHEQLAIHLLERGASPNPSRLDGINPVMLAASNGYTDLLARLLKRKVDVNAKDFDGDTALIWAARMGQTATAKMLIAAGAAVNTADSHGRTALMYAAMNGYPVVTQALLSSKAAVNAKDKSGSTALLLASRYTGDPSVIRGLLKAGANPAAKDRMGKTAMTLAISRGFDAAVAEIRQAGAQASSATFASYEPADVRKTIDSSITSIQSAMKTFNAKAKCTSCHHQGLGLMVLGLGAEKGYNVDRSVIGANLKRLQDESGADVKLKRVMMDPQAVKAVDAVDIGDFPIGFAYLFNGMSNAGVPPNPGFAGASMLIASLQEPDGHWGFGLNRVPIQSSFITTTALCLRVLKKYGPPNDMMKQCFARANSWLTTVSAPNPEDKASRLMGLKWVGADADVIDKATRELIATQRPDGGWAQLPGLRSDAYATGLSLYALRACGGLPTSEPVVSKAVKFLTRMQDEDGTWYVNKRAIPANTYFDAGYPHGQSQYISFGAACWATMALMECQEKSQAARK